MGLYKEFGPLATPSRYCPGNGCKNPAVISANADLDEAGGRGGCARRRLADKIASACSRVYVDKRVKEKFLQLLVGARQEHSKVGDPGAEKKPFVGPANQSRGRPKHTCKPSRMRARSDGVSIWRGHQLTDGGFDTATLSSRPIVRIAQDAPVVPGRIVRAVCRPSRARFVRRGVQEANNSRYGFVRRGLQPR